MKYLSFIFNIFILIPLKLDSNLTFEVFVSLNSAICLFTFIKKRELSSISPQVASTFTAFTEF